jgi:CheY-like chemotaxis protein
MTVHPLRILLAEDDDGHATLIRRNLDRSRLGAEIVRLRNGQELLDHVAGTTIAGRRVLLLLDISMPKVDGIEALRRIKADPSLRAMPVYMLTTTDNPAEVDRCFELGCNAYIMKPIASEAFTAAIQHLCEFLEVSQIPGFPDRTQNVSA